MSRNKHTYTRHASWLVLHVLSNLSPCVLNRLWEKESSRTCTKFVLILTRAFRARDNLVFIVAKSNTYRSVPVKYSSIGGPLLHAVCNTALRVSQEPKNLFSQPKKGLDPAVSMIHIWPTICTGADKTTNGVDAGPAVEAGGRGALVDVLVAVQALVAGCAFARETAEIIDTLCAKLTRIRLRFD